MLGSFSYIHKAMGSVPSAALFRDLLIHFQLAEVYQMYRSQILRFCDPLQIIIRLSGDFHKKFVPMGIIFEVKCLYWSFIDNHC